MSKIMDVAYDVVRISQKFNARGNVSVVTLVHESGYPSARDALAAPTIAEALRAQPSLILDWLQYSENKRSDAGWYFKAGAPNTWNVGFLSNGTMQTEVSFSDPVAACAAFIKSELESINGAE